MKPIKVKITSYKYQEVWYKKGVGEYLIVNADSLTNKKINPDDTEIDNILLSVIKIVNKSTEEYFMTVWNRKFPTEKEKKEFYKEHFHIFLTDTNYRILNNPSKNK